MPACTKSGKQLRGGVNALVALVFYSLLTSIAPVLRGSEPSPAAGEEGTPAADRPRTVADLVVTPEVRRVWDIVLEEAGLEGALDEIALPETTEEVGSVPFPVCSVDVEDLRGREISIMLHPGTGDLIQWFEFPQTSAPEDPTREIEQVRPRIEELAELLLPPASERTIVRGPEYLDNYGDWYAVWKRLVNGVPHDMDQQFMRVSDENLSLRGLGRCHFAAVPADMTVVVDSETAKQIAMELMVDLHQRRIQSLRSSEESSPTPLPEVKAQVCLEPELRIVPFDPEYLTNFTGGEVDARSEMRQAWIVKMNVLEGRKDGCYSVYGDSLSIDAITGQVIGGSHLMCMSEYCPDEGEEETLEAHGCWFWK